MCEVLHRHNMILLEDKHDATCGWTYENKQEIIQISDGWSMQHILEMKW